MSISSINNEEIQRLKFILCQRKKSLIGCQLRLLKAEKDKSNVDGCVSDSARSAINKRCELALSDKIKTEEQVSETEEALKVLLGENWPSFLAEVEAEVVANAKETENHLGIKGDEAFGPPPPLNIKVRESTMITRNTQWIIAGMCLVLFMIVTGCLLIVANRPTQISPAINTSKPINTRTPMSSTPVKDGNATVPAVASNLPDVESGVPASEVIAEEKLSHGNIVGKGCVCVGSPCACLVGEAALFHGRKEAKEGGGGDHKKNHKDAEGEGKKLKKPLPSSSSSYVKPPKDVEVKPEVKMGEVAFPPQHEVKKFVESRNVYGLFHPHAVNRPLPCVFSGKIETGLKLPKECSDVLGVLPDKKGESEEEWRVRAKREVYDKYIELVCADKNDKFYIPLCL